MKVFYSPDVRGYLLELIQILYDKKYFSFEDSAIEYVTDLIQEIDTSINKRPAKIAPPYFSKYGEELYYVIFPKNKNTQWFVFFNVEDDIYFIRYIGSNHTCSQHLL